MENPFAGLSDEDRAELFRAVGSGFGDQYISGLTELQQLLLRADPLHLLAVAGTTSLISSGVPEDEISSSALLLPHFELLQSLVLQHPLGAYGGNIFDSSIIQRIHELAGEVSRAFHMRRVSTLAEGLRDKDEIRKLLFIEETRSATQTVRNWAYPTQIEASVRALFAPFDDEFVAEYGLTSSHMVTVLTTIITVIEERLNEWFRKLHAGLRGKTVTALVRSYHDAFPDVESSPDQLLGLLKRERLSRREAKFLLMSHAVLLLPDVYTFSAGDIAATTGHATETVDRLLESWCHRFGALAQRDAEHFFMGNPIWQRPFIGLEHQRYFLPNAALIYSFMLDMFETKVAGDARRTAKYERRRADYMEDRASELFLNAFGAENVFRGSMWTDPSSGQTFENDLLVVIENWAVVVEVKSGRVTEPARRGAAPRLEKEVKKLVVEPAGQADRFIRYLKGAEAPVSFPTRAGGRNLVDHAAVENYISLSVILQSVGGVGMHWPSLVEAGVISPESPYSPVITIGDLEVVFDLLPRVAEKIHYLHRRMEFEQRVTIHGDELDILAFYLDNGFNIGDEEFRGITLQIGGLSAGRIDRHYMRHAAGAETTKPTRRYTAWWSAILDRVEKVRGERWLDIGLKLLNVTHGDQVKFERAFKKVQETEKTQWRKPGHKNHVVFVNGPSERRDVLIALAYQGKSKGERDDLVGVAASQAMDKLGSVEMVVIGVDVSSPNYPHNLLGMLKPRNDTPSGEPEP